MLESGVHAFLAVGVLVWGLNLFKGMLGYWPQHGRSDAEARALLASDVCTDSGTRLAVGQFDQCANAERVIHISPFHRAVFSVAEDLHICGHRRCEILWLDITERLTLVLTLVFLTLSIVILKWFRLAQVRALHAQAGHWQLPHLKNE